MKPVGVLLAALALSGAAAASAAEIAPPRQPMSNNRASDLQRMEACPVGSQAMLVEPSDVSFWLAQPTTAANPWLTALPADLRLALAEERIDVGSVAVMCVPHSQRAFVGAAQAELSELKLQMLEEAEADGGGYPLGYPDWYDAQQINLPNIPGQFNPFNPTNPGAGANPTAPGGGSNPYGNVPGIGTPIQGFGTLQSSRRTQPRRSGRPGTTRRRREPIRTTGDMIEVEERELESSGELAEDATEGYETAQWGPGWGGGWGGGWGRRWGGWGGGWGRPWGWGGGWGWGRGWGRRW